MLFQNANYKSKSALHIKRYIYAYWLAFFDCCKSANFCGFVTDRLNRVFCGYLSHILREILSRLMLTSVL